MTLAQITEIVQQNFRHHVPQWKDVYKDAVKARNLTKQCRRKREAQHLKQLASDSSLDSRRLEIISAKGAPSWLTALPPRDHGFWLSKRDFRDALALRYDWQLEAVPVTCICGGALSAHHAMVPLVVFLTV